MNIRISQYCRIRDNVINLNDSTVFSSDKTDSVLSFIKSAYKNMNINYPKFYKMDNLSKLAFIASEYLLLSYNKEEKNDKVAIVLSNSASSMDTDIEYFKTIKDINNYYPSPALFVYTLPNIMIGEICIRNKFQGENIFFCTEKFDVELVHSYVNQLFESNKTNLCIAGWVDFLRDKYEAVLFLIEKDINLNGIEFNIDNLKKIYKDS